MKHIHFIGICGVAMSALAIAFKKAGFEVTGSDVGFFPPVSTNLEKHKINFYPGWHPENIGKPDLVIVGNVASSTNPEWLYIQKNKLNFKSYPEAIAEYFVKENSIVCAGTYGKTTSSSLLTWILKQNNFDPTHMFGGISLNDLPAAEITNSKYSILEGDEYKSARWDNGPKFAHYSPTHLLLTSVVWDHADVYPTEKSYIDVFANLLKNISTNGLVVLSAKVIHDQPQLADLPTCKIITYGKTPNNDYQYFDVQTNKEGINFKIKHQSLIFNLQSANLGDYMADNMTGCFALAHQLGIEPNNIIKAITSYKNIKRRLEKKYEDSITVFDDIAHSPKKAEAVLSSLKNIYSGKIIVIFEPNGGNRQIESIPGYDNAFISANAVIIPRLTTIKQDPNKPEAMDGQKLAEVISKTHNNVKYIDDDNKLINYLANITQTGDVVIFCGSHGFRGMIDQLIKQL